MQDIYFEVSQSAPEDIRLSLSVEAKTTDGKLPLKPEDNDFSALWFETPESQPAKHQPMSDPLDLKEWDFRVPRGFKGMVRLSIEDPVDALVRITGEIDSKATRVSGSSRREVR